MSVSATSEITLRRTSSGVIHPSLEKYLDNNTPLRNNPDGLIQKIRRHHRGNAATEELGALAERGEAFAGEPWLTPILGSGPLGLPLSFLGITHALPDAVLQVLKAIPKIADQIIERKDAAGADPHIWIPDYVRLLVQSRTGNVDVEKIEPPELLTESGLLAARIVLVAALTTRLFHRISLDVSRPLSRWGSERAMIGAVSHSAETSAIHFEVTPALTVAIESALEQILQEQAGLKGEPEGEEELRLLRFLERLVDGIRQDAQAADGPIVTVANLTHITEAAWMLLIRAVAGAAFPGWNDLLLRLLIDDENEETHQRPRWIEMEGLCRRIASIFESASRPSGSGADVKDRSENRKFYDSLAKVLWAQSRAKRALSRTRRAVNTKEETALQPLAIVTSFDCELEMALLRTAGPEDTTFSIVLPVTWQQHERDEVGHFAWVQAAVRTTGAQKTDQEVGIPPEIKNPGGGWTGAGEEKTDGPVIVRLTGCPSIELPAAGPDAAKLRFYLERQPQIDKAAELRHIVSLDESTAIQQSGADLSWLFEQEKRGMPKEWFTIRTPTGATRHWMLFGVPYQDPAVRSRLISVLARPDVTGGLALGTEPDAAGVAGGKGPGRYSNDDRPGPSDLSRDQAEDQGGFAEASATSVFDGEEDRKPEESRAEPHRLATEPRTPEPPLTPQSVARRAHRGGRGLAVGVRIDDVDVQLLDDLGLDIVTGRAEVLTESLNAAADLLKGLTAAYVEHHEKGPRASDGAEPRRNA